MKVLHIGTSDSGGAGKGMMNLHHALLEKGVDSKVLVAHKTTCDDSVFQASQNHNLYAFSKNRFVRKLQKAFLERGIGQNDLDRYRRQVELIPEEHSVFFSFPLTRYDISNHPLVQEADIIHLHWISDFVDYPSFFPNVRKKIVWTIRDINPGCGGFHYEVVKDNYYSAVEDALVEIKKQSLHGMKNLHLVALSDVMEKYCKENEILSAFPVTRINNLVNPGLYYSIDKTVAKKVLGIDESEFLVLFVAVSLADPLKNLEAVYAAVQKMNGPVKLVCVGRNDFFTSIPENVICLGTLNNERLMSMVYSAADVFVTPSKQESFGKTTVEALFCGTPVVSKKVGIAPEIINSQNGVLVDAAACDAIYEAIEEVRGKAYNGEEIRQKAIELFDPDRIVEAYKNLYADVLKG